MGVNALLGCFFGLGKDLRLQTDRTDLIARMSTSDPQPFDHG